MRQPLNEKKSVNEKKISEIGQNSLNEIEKKWISIKIINWLIYQVKLVHGDTFT